MSKYIESNNQFAKVVNNEDQNITSKIRNWMKGNVNDYIDTITGEVNITLLAEDCAISLNHDEWLDDHTHEVWDVAASFDNSGINR